MLICNNTTNIANIHPLLINQSQSGQSQTFSELMQAAAYGDPAGANSGRASDSRLAQTINDRGTHYGSSMQGIETSPLFQRALGGDRIIPSDSHNLTAVSYAHMLNQRAGEMRGQSAPSGQNYQTTPYGQGVPMAQPYAQPTQMPQYGQAAPNGQSLAVQDFPSQPASSQGQYSSAAAYQNLFNQQMASNTPRAATIANGVSELVTRNSTNASDKEINTEARQLGRDLRSIVKSSGVSTSDMNKLLGQFTTLADAGYHHASPSEIAYDADRMRETLQGLISKTKGSTGCTSKLTKALEDTTLLSGSLVKRAYQSQGATATPSTTTLPRSYNGYGGYQSDKDLCPYGRGTTTDSGSNERYLRFVIEQMMQNTKIVGKLP